MQLQPLIGEKYNFNAPPKVIKPRAKFRDENNQTTTPNDQAEEEDNKNSYNLMWDRRVVRGNTYASMVTKKSDSTHIQPKSVHKQPKSIIKTPKPLNEYSKNNIDVRVETPKAVAGRVHVSVLTEPFIEVLTDKPPEQEKEALTDFYIDRPVNRLFVYKKDGIDTEAQIWPGELFDFDTEVEPILQVLLGKTLEQSRMEVLEEEELKVMKDQQRQFEQMRNAELSEMQRLEAKESRQLEEIEKRKLQYSKQKDQLIYAHQKLLSRLCSKKLLKYIKPNTFNKLEDIGVFRKPLEFGLYNEYLPWLISCVGEDMLEKLDRDEEFENVLVEMQEGIRNSHIDALKRREQFLEDIRLEKIRKKEEKEENKRKKKEEKLRQIELKRIQDIKDQIINKIFFRNEVKNILNTQTISDIDNAERQSTFIGVFGGFVGELFRFLDATFELLQLKQLFSQINSDSLEKILQLLLDSFLTKGIIEIEIDENCLKDLMDQEPSINLDSVHSCNKAKTTEIIEILKNNMCGTLFIAIVNQAGNLVDFKNRILEFILKYAIEQEKGKNIKFVRTAKRTEFTNKIALCRIAPKAETLVLRHSLLEFYQKMDPAFDPTNHSLNGLWEAELEDKYTTVIPSNFPSNEEIRILVIHQIAQIMLRRGFINDLRTLFPDIQEIEFALEDQLLKLDNELIPSIVKTLHNEMLILDFEMF